MRLSKQISWTLDIAQISFRDMRVNFSGFAGAMPKQLLNKPKISANFQQMSSKAMPQTVKCVFGFYSGSFQGISPYLPYTCAAVFSAILTFK